jgi:branched-chain amino acid aminotransferase
MALDASRLEISALPNPKAIPNSNSEILISLKGSTDRMITATWTTENDWTNTQLVSFGPIAPNLSASALQQATLCFEGMKLFRGHDAHLRLFRPIHKCERILKSFAYL